MECRKIRELLSEYLDGMLDEKTDALVRAHLSECPGCREEHASLQALVHELGAMEAVTPPADFLDRLHDKLEEPSWFSRLLHTLFVPMRFKIPLEFAAVALVAVVIFSMLDVPFDNRRAARSPEEPMVEEMEDRAYLKGTSEAFKQRTSAPEAPAKRRVAKALEKEQKPPEILLVLREQRPSRFMAEASRAPVPGRDRLKSSSDRDFHADSAEGDYALQRPLGAGGKASLEDKALPPTASPGDVIGKLRDAITMLGGQVVTPEAAWQKDDTRVITALIPAKHYTALLEELRSLGTLQGPAPTPSETHEGLLRVQIKVLPQ